MSAKKTAYKHIKLDDRGVPIIDGTNMKVVELIQAKKAHGWSAEELKFQFPHLTLAKIYSALAYYADHQQEMDGDIQARLAAVETLQARAQRPAFIHELKAAGMI